MWGSAGERRHDRGFVIVVGQHPVDAPVPGAGQAVALLVAGGGSSGAVPFQEAK
jgi:hypothetical protein